MTWLNYRPMRPANWGRLCAPRARPPLSRHSPAAAAQNLGSPNKRLRQMAQKIIEADDQKWALNECLRSRVPGAHFGARLCGPVGAFLSTRALICLAIGTDWRPAARLAACPNVGAARKWA